EQRPAKQEPKPRTNNSSGPRRPEPWNAASESCGVVRHQQCRQRGHAEDECGSDTGQPEHDQPESEPTIGDLDPPTGAPARPGRVRRDHAWHGARLNVTLRANGRPCGRAHGETAARAGSRALGNLVMTFGTLDQG